MMKRRKNMIYYVIVFIVVDIVEGDLGFGGIEGE